MKQIIGLVVFYLLYTTRVSLNTTNKHLLIFVLKVLHAKCPCPCSDVDGNVYNPPTLEVITDGCPKCEPLSKCDDKQLETYIIDCPKCCHLHRCNCKDCRGDLLLPPSIRDLPRAPGCPSCLSGCPKCPPEPSTCDAEQVDTYRPRCPTCVFQAGCSNFGCPCIDCHGDRLVPALNPPQKPGPKRCPKCPIEGCFNDLFQCPENATACDADQLQFYVYADWTLS